MVEDISDVLVPRFFPSSLMELSEPGPPSPSSSPHLAPCHRNMSIRSLLFIHLLVLAAMVYDTILIVRQR